MPHHLGVGDDGAAAAAPRHHLAPLGQQAEVQLLPLVLQPPDLLHEGGVLQRGLEAGHLVLVVLAVLGADRGHEAAPAHCHAPAVHPPLLRQQLVQGGVGDPRLRPRHLHEAARRLPGWSFRFRCSVGELELPFMSSDGETLALATLLIAEWSPCNTEELCSIFQ